MSQWVKGFCIKVIEEKDEKMWYMPELMEDVADLHGREQKLAMFCTVKLKGAQ